MKTTPQKILSIVCNFYNIKIEDLKSSKRNANLVYIRQIYSYLSLTYTSEKDYSIGNLINRDRATVWHSHKKILSDKCIYKETSDDLEDLKEIIFANKLIISHVDLLSLTINYTNSFINC